MSKELYANSKDDAVYSYSFGVPYPHHPYSSQRAGPTGPLLLQDTYLLDALAHFDRERIPERVVHANGGGAHGYFEVTDDISDITYAEPFQKIGYKCPTTVRFSTVGGERGSPDTARDPRGFAVKHKTDWGNWDMVGLNSPVFFIRDPVKFIHVNHSQKRDPQTNLTAGDDASNYWNYLVQNPESLHQVVYMFGDRGTPNGWRHMNCFSSHTYKMINKEGKLTYIQFHYASDQGVKNFTGPEAAEMAGKSPDHDQKDLFFAIDNGDFPSWTVSVQTMTPEQAEEWEYSILDMTKTWPYDKFPLRKVGKLVLNKNAENFFEEIEQAAFSPSNLIHGIEASDDPVLQARLFSYPDTARHRLGPNFNQLPVNQARTFQKGSGCPFMAGNFQRDGNMAINNQGNRPNYLSTIRPIQSVSVPNEDFKNTHDYCGVVTKEMEDESFKVQEAAAKKHKEKIWESSSYLYLSGFQESDAVQPRDLYERVYDDAAKQRMIDNVVTHASTIKEHGLKEQVAKYFGRISDDLGKKIADGLGVPY
ncbi:Catalase T [Yarrowia sp. C11]|nr:Catalase T [Yarrowia sp. C11]KAG5371224.1 Catalase T [Yarrowia sp. E02]